MTPPPDAPDAAPSSFRSIRPALMVMLAGWMAFLGWKAAWRHDPALWRAMEIGKLETIVHGGWWWGALGAAIVALLLLFTAGLWLKKWPAFLPVPRLPPSAGRPRWLIPAVLLIMAGGAALRAPRLGLSLYNDEAHVFRAQLAGEIPKKHHGNPDAFRPASWLSTLYENRAGNNSLPFSVLARTSYTAWRALTKSPVGRVHEASLRFPVLICGVLAIGGMAWLGYRLGGPRAALAAALLTALHPWHMRYSVEARAYGILLLVLPLLFIALDSALRSGKWRHWLAFGFLQWLTLATWFGSAHLLLALNLTLAAVAVVPLIRSRRVTAVHWHLIAPAVVSGCLALGLYLQINLPHYLQLAKALAHPGFFKSPDPFPAAWFQDVAGYLGLGIPGLPVSGGLPVQPSVAGSWGTPLGGLLAAGAAALVLALGAGFVRSFQLRGAALLLAAATVGGAFLTWGYCSAKGIVFLKWYPLFILPGLLMAAALGLSPQPRTGKTSPLRHAGAVLLLLLIAAAWIPGLRAYAGHGRENLRGSIELAMGRPYPEFLSHPERPLYAVTWSESAVYDLHALPLKDAGSLSAAVARARQEKRPLFAAYGHAASARTQASAILAMLEDPALFRPAGVLPGLDESECAHFVFELLPEPAPASR